MNSMTRREFLRLAGVGTAGVLVAESLTACGIAGPAAGPTGTAAGTATPQTLRNQNLPDFNVRYYTPFPAPDPAQWRLSVEGMVKNPQSLSLDDVQGLPSVIDIRRLKCVECWSARAEWQGFSLDTLMGLVEPESEASWLHFLCADGYYESLWLEELSQEGVQFAYGMNDELLLPEYGSPLRLVVPQKYGYKWPKAIVRLEFADRDKAGYWPTVGPYTTSGAIVAGLDHPQDLPDGSRAIQGGEVLYPEDLEARESLR
jgi:sulfoxide reductase catalytic subunit YedY